MPRKAQSSAAALTASLQAALPQGSAEAPGAAVKLYSEAKAEKVRALLEEVREALSDEEFDRAEKDLAEALRLDPYSRPALSLKKELQEEREEARQEVIRKQVAEHHERGLRVLAESDVQGALRAFEVARGLDPSDSRTFRLIEHAHRVRQRDEARQRRRAFREGTPPEAEQEASSTRAVPADTVPAGGASFSVPGLILAPPAGTGPGTVIGHPVPHKKEEAAARASARPGEYVVQPEDVLQITVFEEPDLTTKARVSRDGEVTFPLLGQVRVAGLTVAQAQERLTRLLGAEYLVHPQVQVFVDKPRNVFVTGEVRRPGSYPVSVEREMTIMEIISMAGGFTEDAEMNGTRIIRVESGQKRTLRVRVGDIVRKGDKGQDVGVLPDDIVFVPESFF